MHSSLVWFGRYNILRHDGIEIGKRDYLGNP
jgi:hypothetical protein